MAAILLPPLTPQLAWCPPKFAETKNGGFYFQKPPTSSLTHKKSLPFQRLFFICRWAI